ncbi:hypothetical protein V8C86DRAFT_970584 [Haematococcus lacustris]
MKLFTWCIATLQWLAVVAGAPNLNRHHRHHHHCHHHLLTYPLPSAQPQPATLWVATANALRPSKPMVLEGVLVQQQLGNNMPTCLQLLPQRQNLTKPAGCGP